jgi:sugar O-acyltransferase (sialic acid O-acetyltransferase NeuD family)
MDPFGRIVIIGGGGNAKVLISTLHKLPYEILGYTDPVDHGPILDAAYLGADEMLAEFLASRGPCKAAIGVGKIDASPLRARLAARVAGLGFELPVIVSPAALVNEGVLLGAGTTVFDRAVVNSGTVTGEICILNTNCTVEHDCTLGDNVHVAPGAVLSGEVRVGSNTMIGAGAVVVQGVGIGADCLIGAGAVVVSDLEEPGTYVGTPARRIG